MSEQADPSSNPGAPAADRGSETRVEKATFAMGAGCSAEWIFVNNLSLASTVFATRVGIATGTNPDVTAEAVEITFDPASLTYEALLTSFFNAHDRWGMPDPRQPRFADAVFAHSPEQRAEAERFRDQFVPFEYPPGHDDRPTPVTSLICDAASFQVGPDRDQQVIVGMMTEIATGFRRRLEISPTGRMLVPPVQPTLEPSGMAILAELRRLAEEMGCCLDVDEPSLGPQATGTSFVDVVFTILRHDPRLAEQLNVALRSWRATQPSLGLADGQTDARVVEVGVKTLDAESYIRFNRTDSALNFISRLAPGHSRPVGFALSLRRRALTDRDRDGRPLDTIKEERGVRSGVLFGTQRKLTYAPLEAGGEEGSWYEHLGPVEMPVSCFDGSSVHTVRWTQGRIEAPATAGIDASRETTLRELGAPTCRCWDVLDIWNPAWIFQRFRERFVDDVLRPADWWDGASVGDAEPGQVLQMPKADLQQWAQLPQLARDRLGPFPTRANLPDPEGALDDPFAPPVTSVAHRAIHHFITGPSYGNQLPALRTRWLLAALAWMGEHHDRLGPDDRTNYALLIFRHIEQPLLEALWQPCHYDPKIRMAAIQFHLLAPGERATVTGTVEGELVKVGLGVSFHWITQVWTRCLAIIDNHLVLDAGRQTEAASLDVVVAQWDRDTDHSAGATLVTRDAKAQWDGAAWRLGSDS